MYVFTHKLFLPRFCIVNPVYCNQYYTVHLRCTVIFNPGILYKKCVILQILCVSTIEETKLTTIQNAVLCLYAIVYLPHGQLQAAWGLYCTFNTCLVCSVTIGGSWCRECRPSAENSRNDRYGNNKVVVDHLPIHGKLCLKAAYIYYILHCMTSM